MSEQSNPTDSTTAEITSIWLTRSSVKPAWLALSILGMLTGLFAFWPLLVASAVTALLITLSWAADARAESDELPLR